MVTVAAGSFGFLTGYFFRPLWKVLSEWWWPAAQTRSEQPILPLAIDHRMQSLQTTASFIDAGGAEAVAHVAAKMGVEVSKVQQWYVRWQQSLEGPRM